MKNFSLIFGLIFLCNTAHPQTIRGLIMESSTKGKISFATVYMSGTYVGTMADQNGYFQLKVPSDFSMPLTISALGYYSCTLTKYYLSDTVNIILLEPKVYELQEVLITEKAINTEKRNEYLQLFKNEFLGTSISRTNCEIVNENDISFSYDYQTNIFKAYSSKPIIINNDYLGYRIEYYLDKFEFQYLTTTGRIKGIIVGNYKFIEKNYRNSNQQKRFENRRKITYFGSRMHFFRELWNNSLDSSGFELKDSLNNKIDLKSNLIESKVLGDSIKSKCLKFDGRIFLSYYSKRYSTIIKVKDKVYFDKNGFFDPYAIIWEGKMSEQRIGDILPFEYQINNNLKINNKKNND